MQEKLGETNDTCWYLISKRIPLGLKTNVEWDKIMNFECPEPLVLTSKEINQFNRHNSTISFYFSIERKFTLPNSSTALSADLGREENGAASDARKNQECTKMDS